jgi:hypothetical protein
MEEGTQDQHSGCDVCDRELEGSLSPSLEIPCVILSTIETSRLLWGEDSIQWQYGGRNGKQIKTQLLLLCLFILRQGLAV